MTSRNNTLLRALGRFTLVAAASVAAASLWAQARPEPGLLLDAQSWQEEVLPASTGPWPEDGWYRLLPEHGQVDVRVVRPSEHADASAAEAVYVRLPGTLLQTGLRTASRDASALQSPRLGTDYELSLEGKRFSVRVEPAGEKLQYVIGYGGQNYVYELGLADAQTAVRAVADLDGDAAPDFVIDVEDATFLLLSTRARPGVNLPSAELRNHGC